MRESAIRRHDTYTHPPCREKDEIVNSQLVSLFLGPSEQRFSIPTSALSGRCLRPRRPSPPPSPRSYRSSHADPPRRPRPNEPSERPSAAPADWTRHRKLDAPPTSSPCRARTITPGCPTWSDTSSTSTASSSSATSSPPTRSRRPTPPSTRGATASWSARVTSGWAAPPEIPSRATA